MSDTAQNSNANVNDIWSLPSPPAGSANDRGKIPARKRPSGSFGKPGLAGGGESDENWESEAAEKDAERVGEIYKAPETLVSPEVGEKQKAAGAQKPKKEPEVESPEVVQDISTKGKIIDKRTGKERTHRVDKNADSITKIADVKEQEFIEGVESIHSIV